MRVIASPRGRAIAVAIALLAAIASPAGATEEPSEVEPVASQPTQQEVAAQDGIETSSTTNYFPLRHYASLVPQPAGYPTNSCYKRTSGSTNYYFCRKIVDNGTYTILKSSSALRDVSDWNSTYGRQVTTSRYVYEGCRDTGSYWSCDRWGYNQWVRRTTSVRTHYYLDAFREVAITASCAIDFATGWQGPLDWFLMAESCSAVRFWAG